MANLLASAGLVLLLLLTRMSLIFSLPSTFTLEVLLRRLQAVNYDSNQWPTYSDTPAAPTRVNVSIFVNSFGAPQASTMDYELDIYLRQQWLDERLRVPGDPDEMLIVSRKNVIDQLWTPDLYFLNLKDAKYHDVTMPNVLMRVYQDGRVFYSIRLKLSLSCQMNLQRYPLDSQRCGIQLATYAHPTSALEFFWSQGTSGGCEGICYSKLEIPQFTLLGVRDMTNITLVYHTGNFSALSALFTLDRQNGYHILQTYIPTMLMVCMSWVSFWLEQTATPARVTLGVTTLLTLTSLAAGVRSELPPVSYLKAIDVWIGTCMIFVFGALLEFVLVHYLAKKRKLQGDRRKSVKEMFFSKEEGEAGSSAVPHGPAAGKKQTHILQAKAVDRVCRVVIPLFFLTFNCIYWSMYAQGDE